VICFVESETYLRKTSMILSSSDIFLLACNDDLSLCDISMSANPMNATRIKRLSNKRCEELPLIRKIIQAGRTSQAVILPKSWLEFHEKESGCRISQVLIEVNTELRISPVLPKKEDCKAVECASRE